MLQMPQWYRLAENPNVAEPAITAMVISKQPGLLKGVWRFNWSG